MSEAHTASGLDEVEQLISAEYLAVRLRSGQRDPVFTASQSTVGPVVIGRMFYDMTVDMDAEPLRAIGIVHPRGGTATYRSRGQQRTWGVGDLCVHADPADAFTAAFDHLDCDFAIFDPALLSDVASTAPGDEAAVRLLDYRPVDPHAAAEWLRSLAFVRSLTADGGGEPAPLIATHAARLLAAATLATFPSNALIQPTASDRRDAHPPTLRRALAFIEAHPDQDLTVVDIARAAYVTPRALQLAFRRHLDTAPMAHLRRVRLDHAHRDLVDATPGDGTTVSDVAARWGFTASRFAAVHRAAYNEAPAVTLRR